MGDVLDRIRRLRGVMPICWLAERGRGVLLARGTQAAVGALLAVIHSTFEATSLPCETPIEGASPQTATRSL